MGKQAIIAEEVEEKAERGLSPYQQASPRASSCCFRI